MWSSKCAFVSLANTQGNFYFIYNLTSLLHSFMNSFQGVSSDITILYFLPYFVQFLWYFFSEFKFFAKKQFQSFQWIYFYCWKYWFLVFILMQGEGSVLNGKNHCPVGWVISGLPVILGYNGSFFGTGICNGNLIDDILFSKINFN